MTKTTHLLFSLSLALAVSSPVRAETPSRKSFVDFNTQCAHCHDGECSGRLSFSSGSEGAANHLRRYLGNELTDEEINQLYGLLRYTKEKCEIYPFPEHWDQQAATLDDWRGSRKNGYFVPLGNLEGEFTVEMELEETGPDSWQLLNPEHEVLAEGRFCPKAQSQEVFKADKSPLYLQLQGKGQIRTLQIGSQPK